MTLSDFLGAVASTRGTGLERLCWDLNIEESRVRPVWDVALRVGLLEPAGHEPLTGSPMYALSDRGRRAVRELRLVVVASRTRRRTRPVLRQRHTGEQLRP